MGVKRHLRSLTGFTLLELLIVIFIVGISSSIVILFVGKAYDNAAFKEAVKKVYIVLKHARETAIIERTTITFKTDPEKGSFWTEKGDSVYGKVYSMPDDMSITGEAIIFFPKGNSSGGLIKIIDKRKRLYYVEVNPILGTPKIKGL
jgi:general secretion pathway protein H